MSGMMESQPDSGGDLCPGVIVSRFKLSAGATHIPIRVEWFRNRITCTGFFLRPAHIFPLNVRAVPQHDFRNVCCGPRTPDWAIETLVHKSGQIPAMVNVCMGEDNSVQTRRITAKMTIAVISFRMRPLEQAAVKQDACRLCFNQMLTSRNLASRPQKRDFHSSHLSMRQNQFLNVFPPPEPQQRI